MNPIREASERITAENWHKGDMSSEDKTAFCGLGHLVRVLDIKNFGRTIFSAELGREVSLAYEAMQIMHKVAKEQYPDRVDGDALCFAAFNDHPDTRVEEVRSVMDKAAVVWDERHA